MPTGREELVRDFAKAVTTGNGAFFVGAGLSKPSGLVDWRGLLKQVAKDLDLNVDQETDLIALAQYHHNEKKSRHKLNQLIIDEFTKDVAVSENHRLIANLPVSTVWTTNYDNLLETAFQECDKKVDLKHNHFGLAHNKPNRHVVIYKVHGDADHPNEAVLTKEDYELFDQKRQLFSIQLKGDLVAKTFLFLGYSLTDPNIDYILSRIRLLLDQDIRPHYCLMRKIPSTGLSRKKKAEAEYDQRRQVLRINDLKRYGIQTVLVDEFAEITDVLREINHRVHLMDVFVSGSAYNYDPLGKDNLLSLCESIGAGIIKHGLNLVSGYGEGIGQDVITGALSRLPINDESRLVVRPFPQRIEDATERKAVWKKFREEMIGRAGFCVFICGNRLKDSTDADLGYVDADGVLAEFEICKAVGRLPVPIGASGHAARKIWESVNSSLKDYFPHPAKVRTAFRTLGDENASPAELSKAVFSIIQTVRDDPE
jgi:hypothetical protein